MSNGAGIWLDHRRALVVNFSADGHRIEEFFSGLRRLLKDVDGSQPRSLFGTKSKGARGPLPAPAEKVDLNAFLEVVAIAVRNADSIAVIGPGQAKSDLRKHLAQHRLEDRITSFEPAARMTDAELVKHFQSLLFPEIAKKPVTPAARERKSRKTGKGVPAEQESRVRNTPPLEAAAAPKGPSRKRPTGPAARTPASEPPEKRRLTVRSGTGRSGTGRANPYANMPRARKAR